MVKVMVKENYILNKLKKYMKTIFKDIALYVVAFILILVGAIILLNDKIEYSIYIKALIFSTAVWCGFKINTYREKIEKEDD